MPKPAATVNSACKGAVCVLVAGEHWKLATGERNMGTNHCSLEHVGEAFDALRAAGVPRDRIIVIAQLAEAREWLREAIQSGEPLCASVGGDEGRARSRNTYTRKLAELERRCGGILAEGGADYDRSDVNPETVYRVLTAGLDSSSDTGQPVGGGLTGPVVPAGAALLFAVYSHGCSHETAEGTDWDRLITKIPCDVCGRPHITLDPGNALPPAPGAGTARAPAAEPGQAKAGSDSVLGDPSNAALQRSAAHIAAKVYDHEHMSFQTNEWYIHLPYSAPSCVSGGAANTNGLYAGIAHAVHPHPYSLLYWQILFKAFHRRFVHSLQPARKSPPPIVALLNSCRSGGMAKFLGREQFEVMYGVQSWPLFIMCSAQPEKDAVVGGLWTLWFQQVANLGQSQAQDQPKCRSATGTKRPREIVTESCAKLSQETCLLPHPCLEFSPVLSIGNVFRRVSMLYNRRESYDLKNRIMSEWLVPPDVLDEAIAALDDALGLGWRPGGRMEVHSERCGGQGFDYEELDALARTFRITARRNCLRCKVWARTCIGGNGRGLLCSGCERGWVGPPPTTPDDERKSESPLQLGALVRRVEGQIARPIATWGRRSGVDRLSLREFLLGPSSSSSQR